MRTRWILGLSFALVAAPLPAAAAATITVTTTTDEFADPGPDTGCSLREAIRAANTEAPYGGCPAGSGSDTVLLGSAGYVLTLPGSPEDAAATGDLDVLGDLTIVGQGAAATTIDGGGLDRVLQVDTAPGGPSPSLTLTGLTIRGGEGVSFGGGILTQYEGELTMDGVVVTDNEASDTGAGVHVENDATARISNSSISGNRSENAGGGIGNWDQAEVDLTNVTVADNIADSGGGIINENDGRLTITNSTISGNVAPSDHGGGIVVNNSSVVAITNSTIGGNRSERSGGALYVFGTNAGFSIAFTNTTLAGNIADSDGDDDGDGGGILIEPPLTGPVNLKNTILADNSDASGGAGTVHPDCSAMPGDEVTSQGHNLIESTTGCAIDGTATGNITGADPMLGPLADNGGPTMTHALLAGSPAINAADPGAAPATDQRGVPRGPDIGAYELAFCQGLVINRVGSGAADVLTGTEGADGFLAQGGDDTVNALGGDDAVCPGDGNDIVDSGPGNDVVSGESGNDTAHLGAGKDTATGGEGNDKLTGGGGKDLLKGEAGKDKLKGQGGKDRLKGGPGKDTCTGGGGKDKATCEREKKIP